MKANTTASTTMTKPIITKTNGGGGEVLLPSKTTTMAITIPTFRRKPLRMVKHSYKNRVVLPSSKKSRSINNNIFLYFSILTEQQQQLGGELSYKLVPTTAAVEDTAEEDRLRYPIEVNPSNEIMTLLLEQEQPHEIMENQRFVIGIEDLL